MATDDNEVRVDETLETDVDEPVDALRTDATLTTDADGPAAPMGVDPELAEDLAPGDAVVADSRLGQDLDEANPPRAVGLDPELFG